MNVKDIVLADRQRKSGGVIARFLYILRTAHYSKNKFVKILCKVLLRRYRLKYGLEIPAEAKIGKGLYLGHAFNITVNNNAVIGDWCNLHKGIVIGRENRGKREGAPRLGNKVWVGINSAIVGNVTIGNDVLIAPCSYVNCDVSSHSVVFGNPCIIKHRDNATEGYINNVTE